MDYLATLALTIFVGTSILLYIYWAERNVDKKFLNVSIIAYMAVVLFMYWRLAL